MLGFGLAETGGQVAYREVGMFEVKEVLRLRIGGAAKKQIARQVGLDPKTVRRYLEVAQANGLEVGPGPPGLTDERLSAVLVALRTDGGRPHGDSWACVPATPPRFRVGTSTILDVQPCAIWNALECHALWP